jgi:hypothetical protein
MGSQVRGVGAVAERNRCARVLREMRAQTDLLDRLMARLNLPTSMPVLMQRDLDAKIRSIDAAAKEATVGDDGKTNDGGDWDPSAL